MSDEGEYDDDAEGEGDEEEESAAASPPPSRRRVRPRPHALFPRAPGAGPEDRDICFVGIQRKLAPAEAKRVGHKIEYCPVELAADDLPDWAAVHARFGGGQYKVCAKDASRHILCWAPAGEGNWYYMAGRSRPFADDDEEEDSTPVAAPPPPPPPPPPAAPSFDIGAFMLGLARMQQDAADRQREAQQASADRQMELMTRMTEQTNQILTALLNRPEPRAPAMPQPDPLAGVKLGAEMTKAAQPAAAPTLAADPHAQMRQTIELVKEVQGLAPATAGGASDAAEVSTIFSGLTTLVNGLKASAPAQEPFAPLAAKVLINGRYLTAEQAALEYSRLSSGPPAAPPAPVQVPASAPVNASPPSAPAPPATASPPAAQGELDVDAVLARLRDPAFADKLKARIATTHAAAAHEAAAPATPSPATSAPASLSPSPSPPSPSSSSTTPTADAASSGSSPRPVPAVAASPAGAQEAPPSPVASALASMPRELVGHVATLDPGQFVALAKMHPDAIARSVRGLQGMDDDKAKSFGEAIGNLPPEALPLLSMALPSEARKFLGLAS